MRFALAIAGAPKLLVLDEPTAAMDVESRRAFWASMRDYAAGGRTILFATHYLEEADENADRVIVIARGRIVADGTAAQIKAGAGGRRVRFALGDQPADGAGRAARRHRRRDRGGHRARCAPPTPTPPWRRSTGGTSWVRDLRDQGRRPRRRLPLPHRTWELR